MRDFVVLADYWVLLYCCTDDVAITGRYLDKLAAVRCVSPIRNGEPFLTFCEKSVLRVCVQASMLPGQKFDESRLVKPGDWDKLAADDDEDDLLDFEAQMESDFAVLKAEVAAEKAKGEVKSKAAKPIELTASENAATQDLTQID